MKRGDYVRGIADGFVVALTDKHGGRAKVGERWVDQSKLTIVPDDARVLSCDGCNGSGIFRGGGMVLNGRYVGYEGDCYRCEGHGKQTPKDRRRNRHYDNHIRTIHA